MRRVIVPLFVMITGCVSLEPAAEAELPGAESAEIRRDAGTTQDGGVSDAGVALSLNAVSMLFPTEAPAGSALLKLSDVGQGGPLLTKQHYDAVQTFTQGTALDYASWRIVAARVDPCFPSLELLKTNPASCRRQLRLVAQPLKKDGTAGYEDSGLHLLFDLTEADFTQLAKAWVAPLRNQAGAHAERMGVSPTLKSEGLTGPYGQQLRALILQHAGAATLAQFTFMHGLGFAWEFGGFMVQGTARSRIQVPGLEPVGTQNSEDQTTFAGPNQVFSLLPESATTRALRPLAGRFELVGGSFGRLVFDAPQVDINQAFQISLDLENPKSPLHADSTDCSSCHMATRAREQALVHGRDAQSATAYSHPFRPLELSAEAQRAESDTTLQRMFGYFDNAPVISPRAVNESAEIADYLEAWLATH